jgi:putative transposase
VKHAFIEAERGQYTVGRLCHALGVSRSGYYGAKVRPECARRREDRRLTEAIEAVHGESRQTYGAVKTWRVLNARGIPCGKHRIARLRRAARLEVRRRKRFRHVTEQRQLQPPAPNHVARQFTVPAPDRVWAGDITFIATRAGWLYLAVLIDLNARRVVGWAMRDAPDQTLVLAALSMAVEQRRPAPGLVLHSDQGRPYASLAYQAMLGAHGMVQSMSRKGDCWDNAVVESFFSTLKNDLVHHRRYATRDEARRDVFDFIELFYNRRRAHAYLDYRSPIDHEKMQTVP